MIYALIMICYLEGLLQTSHFVWSNNTVSKSVSVFDTDLETMILKLNLFLRSLEEGH